MFGLSSRPLEIIQIIVLCQEERGVTPMMISEGKKREKKKRFLGILICAEPTESNRYRL